MTFLTITKNGHSAAGHSLPTFSIKEQFLSSMGQTCRLQTVNDTLPHCQSRHIILPCKRLWDLASAPQPVSLAHLDKSIWLCDSIHQTPSQVQGHPLYIDNRQRCPCPPVLCAEITVLLIKDVIEPVPPAKMKSGFYSPLFIKPKKTVQRYQYNVLLFGLSLSPHIFTKVTEGALSLLS